MARVSQNKSTLAHSEATPIASSQTLGWQPLLVEEFQQPPGGTDILESWEGHSIALCLAPRPHRIHQVVGDRRYTGLYAKGDISITPANIPASYWTEGEDHYFHVQIPTQFLQEVAQSAAELDSDDLELANAFKVRDPQLEQILMLLRTELHQGNSPAGQLYVESLANVLAVSLLRQYSTTEANIPLYSGGLGDRKILQISDYVHAHLDQSIKLADLAEVAGMSQFHFSRMFKQSTGITPHQYVLRQRIEQAKQLLKGTKLAIGSRGLARIADIAFECGFSSQSHFSKHFREVTGITPSQYRQS